MHPTTGFALCASITALVSTPSPARADDAQAWLMLNAAADLGENATASFDFSPRGRSAASGGDQILLRASIDATVAKGLKLGGGLAFSDSASQQELRPHQQLTFSSGPIALRTRLEQRFIDGADRVGLRLRQRIQAKLPLDPNDQITASAEAFFVLRATATGKPTGFDQFRLTLAEMHRISPDLEVGAAYLLIGTNLRSAPYRYSHVAQVLANLRL